MENKLNIGCRTDIKSAADGWINLDVVKYPGVDIVANVLDASFEEDKFDVILASDILEHFTNIEGEKFLTLCRKWLKKGGILELRLPNIRTLAQAFLNCREEKDREYVINWIYGDYGQDRHNLHLWGYTEESIRKALEGGHGFNVITFGNDGWNMVIKAERRG